MTEYVLQTKDDIKQLIKCYTVTPDCPVRQAVSEGRTQLITTNTDRFNEAVATYRQYGLEAKFTIANEDITWTTPDD